MVSASPPKQILVADDDKFCQMALASIVKATGAVVTMTDDGDKCVKEYLSNPKKYHLILMDICMPTMDGYQATMAIRKTDKKIKIVGLSADGDEDTVELAMRSGMNQVMQKPIRKVELQNIIKGI